MVHFLEAIEVCVLGHFERFSPHDVPVVALRGLEACAAEGRARAVVMPGGRQLEEERAPTLDIMWCVIIFRSATFPHTCAAPHLRHA